MDVGDVGIYIYDDIAFQLIDGLPQVFAFAAFGLQVGQDIAGQVGVGTELGGNLEGAVFRAGVL